MWRVLHDYRGQTEYGQGYFNFPLYALIVGVETRRTVNPTNLLLEYFPGVRKGDDILMNAHLKYILIDGVIIGITEVEGVRIDCCLPYAQILALLHRRFGIPLEIIRGSIAPYLKLRRVRIWRPNDLATLRLMDFFTFHVADPPAPLQLKEEQVLGGKPDWKFDKSRNSREQRRNFNRKGGKRG